MSQFIKKIFFLLFPVVVSAQSQQQEIDSMHLSLRLASDDTTRMKIYKDLAYYYDDVDLDSCVFYNEKGLAIAQQLKSNLDEAYMLMSLSFPLTKMGNYPRSLKVLIESSNLTENSSTEKKSGYLLQNLSPQKSRLTIECLIRLGLGYLYSNTGNYEKGIAVYPKGIRMAESISNTVLLANLYGDLGVAYYNLGKLDSALITRQKALTYFSLLPFDLKKFEADVYSCIGDIYQQMGKTDLAKNSYETAIKTSEKYNNPALLGEAYLKLARLYLFLKNTDSSLWCTNAALDAFSIVGKNKFKADVYKMISRIYGIQKNVDSSFAYLKPATNLSDSLDNTEKKRLQEYQAVGFNEQLRLQKLEKEKIQTQTAIRTYTMLTGIILIMMVAFLLYRNNQKEKRAKIQLQDKNKIIENTLTELNATQSQLIQSEKMASLGELTAGIAHEIQNPLNFVNNFSEVSRELIDELKTQKEKLKSEEQDEILNDIDANLEKINHHGKRADAIVKGMLQHSQKSAGQKELTDINAMCDEHLRLSYNGLRAKDKNFNATLKTDFDNSIGKINIVPQDIGRAIINILTNAFYAVNERKQSGSEVYEPIVSLSTKQNNGTIEIKVAGNGNGIPKNIIDKIFQPFFTTKPTGQGTGLGLSFAYDIITKEHIGSIKVESKEGEGTTFIINLPAT
ncbi:MAG: ATP-binding protein [Bacteroidota bacterium]